MNNEKSLYLNTYHGNLGFELVSEKLNNVDVDQLLESLLGKEETPIESTLVKEQTIVRIRLEKRRRHVVTVIEIDGADAKKLDIESLAKELKRKLAAGGTVHDNVIELQGDHRYKVKKILTEMGFNPDNILIDESVHEA